MLGLADSNDPTPPISRWRLWGFVSICVGVAEAVFGAIRMTSEFSVGLTFLCSAAAFIALGIARLISRRRAAGSDGGTDPHR
ncbi:hypothetical protein [Pseudolysinimonas sp.]|uniref:hypothetical protein n=1 Tax=Pseudolysinimonas sp. TaxID=2680009 RepID=UPI003F7D590A